MFYSDGNYETLPIRQAQPAGARAAQQKATTTNIFELSAGKEIKLFEESRGAVRVRECPRKFGETKSVV